jgi:hypothetical protein
MWKISYLISLLIILTNCQGKPDAPLTSIEKELIKRLSEYGDCEVEREFVPYMKLPPYRYSYSWMFHFEWNRFEKLTTRDKLKIFSEIKQIIKSTTLEIGCINMPISEFSIYLKTEDYSNGNLDGASISFYDMRISCYSPYGKQRIYSEKIFE